MRADILVTGADSFVGQALCALFTGTGLAVRGAVRSDAGQLGLACPHVAIGDIGTEPMDGGAARRRGHGPPRRPRRMSWTIAQSNPRCLSARNVEGTEAPGAPGGGSEGSPHRFPEQHQSQWRGP